jgi:GntR family transcriptional regulator
MPDYTGISSRSDLWVHEQVARAIEDAIRSGELAPGDRLPAQSRIADEAGVSEHTVNAAVRLLRDKGLLYTRRRLGTFVARDIPPPTPPGPAAT